MNNYFCVQCTHFCVKYYAIAGHSYLTFNSNYYSYCNCHPRTTCLLSTSATHVVLYNTLCWALSDTLKTEATPTTFRIFKVISITIKFDFVMLSI